MNAFVFVLLLRRASERGWPYRRLMLVVGHVEACRRAERWRGRYVRMVLALGVPDG